MKLQTLSLPPSLATVPNSSLEDCNDIAQGTTARPTGRCTGCQTGHNVSVIVLPYRLLDETLSTRQKYCVLVLA